MHKMNDIAQRVIVMMMAMVLLTMQESLVRYRHAHLLADGTVVWHSHPFGDSQHNPGGKTHQHAPGNQFAFDQISQSMPITGLGATIPKNHPCLRSSHTAPNSHRVIVARRSATQLRAPPVDHTLLAA